MKQSKWIEHIRVRSSSVKLQEAMPSLFKQIQEVKEQTGDAETFFMKHAIYDGDLSVVVVWHNNMEPKKTREGLMIAEKMQELGPIDHAVWIPAESIK